MSSRWSCSSGASGGTLALRAASCVAASMSARSSLRVISTMKPSPMRVGTFASTGSSLRDESRRTGREAPRRPPRIVSAERPAKAARA